MLPGSPPLKDGSLTITTGFVYELLNLTVSQLWSTDIVPYSPRALIVIDRGSEDDDTFPAASVAVAVRE